LASAQTLILTPAPVPART